MPLLCCLRKGWDGRGKGVRDGWRGEGVRNGWRGKGCGMGGEEKGCGMGGSPAIPIAAPEQPYPSRASACLPVCSTSGCEWAAGTWNVTQLELAPSVPSHRDHVVHSVALPFISPRYPLPRLSPLAARCLVYRGAVPSPSMSPFLPVASRSPLSPLTFDVPVPPIASRSPLSPLAFDVPVPSRRLTISPLSPRLRCPRSFPSPHDLPSLPSPLMPPFLSVALWSPLSPLAFDVPVPSHRLTVSPLPIYAS
ncbi:unnamed protein product [Closterium sp. NIES-65]|nr:unnamed protein product [Closterium sp. NIES-65]